MQWRRGGGQIGIVAEQCVGIRLEAQEIGLTSTVRTSILRIKQPSLEIRRIRPVYGSLVMPGQRSFLRKACCITSNRSSSALGTDVVLASSNDRSRGRYRRRRFGIWLAPNWSAAIEYDHIFTDRQNDFVTLRGVPS